MINPFINVHQTRSEQELLQSLSDEIIQMYGTDIKYAVREMVTRDAIFGESVISDFKDWVEIEVLIEDMQGFNGDGDLFTKFGMEMTDQCTLVVSKKRFAEEFHHVGFTRPKEGDLIQDPLTSSLWEIRKVKQDRDYFKLGKNYVYRMECSLFQYNHEKLPEDDEGFQAIAGLTEVSVDQSNSLLLSLTEPNFQEEAPYIVEEAEPAKVASLKDPFGEFA